MARGGIPRAQGGSSHDMCSRDVHLADRQREEKTILEFARAVRDREGKVIRHLDDAASVRPYCRKADEVAAVVGKGRVFDWDCLYGQMTFLLERRGLTVVPFDLEESRRERTLWEQVGRSPIYSQDPVKLPFEAGAFDAVLSSGTLEHVADPEASLREIHRILRAGGTSSSITSPTASPGSSGSGCCGGRPTSGGTGCGRHGSGFGPAGSRCSRRATRTWSPAPSAASPPASARSCSR